MFLIMLDPNQVWTSPYLKCFPRIFWGNHV